MVSSAPIKNPQGILVIRSFQPSTLFSRLLNQSSALLILVPRDDPDRVVFSIFIILIFFKKRLPRYMPWISSLPLYQGMRWKPTWKALPTFHHLMEVFKQSVSERTRRNMRSCFPSNMFEMSAYSFLTEFIRVRGELNSGHRRFSFHTGLASTASNGKR